MYIYENFGYDINEVGSFHSHDSLKGGKNQAQQAQNDSITTNQLNNSMQHLKSAFKELNAFTD